MEKQANAFLTDARKFLFKLPRKGRRAEMIYRAWMIGCFTGPIIVGLIRR